MTGKLLEKELLLKTDITHSFCSAVIVAAGKGRRMESRVNKVYIDLMGKKTIVRTLEPFQKSSMIDEIILVVNENDITYCTNEVIDKTKFIKVKKIIAGGNNRQTSVYNGIKEISKKSELVIIHDGARPLVTEDVIERSIKAVLEHDAVSVGMPVKDTIKMINNEGYVVNTLERTLLWSVQTPQVFKKDIILEAHNKAIEFELKATDDAMLVEKLGYKLKLIEGSYENIKLTTPEDVIVACAIIKEREELDLRQ